MIEHHVGGQRWPIKTPSGVEFPNLAFYIPESDVDPFLEHFKKQAIKGQPPARLTGQIEIYDNGMKDTLFTLHFAGADILGITPDRSDASTEDIKQVKVELHTEKMTFEYA